MSNTAPTRVSTVLCAVAVAQVPSLASRIHLQPHPQPQGQDNLHAGLTMIDIKSYKALLTEVCKMSVVNHGTVAL
ncbi:hypothetical protein BKA63DRAFT_498767 [Paraphoma chrysanthemicola]|nr:hypothetical protein BKA63DRAFT_498767 [Paraphoma chrysanthemicola]